MCTGVQQRLHLIVSQGLGTPLLAFERNETSLHGLGFGKTVEEGLVAAIGKHEKPVEGQLWKRVHAHVKVVETMHAAQNLVNGGVRAACLLGLERDDRGL